MGVGAPRAQPVCVRQLAGVCTLGGSAAAVVAVEYAGMSQCVCCGTGSGLPKTPENDLVGWCIHCHGWRCGSYGPCDGLKGVMHNRSYIAEAKQPVSQNRLTAFLSRLLERQGTAPSGQDAQGTLYLPESALVLDDGHVSADAAQRPVCAAHEQQTSRRRTAHKSTVLPAARQHHPPATLQVPMAPSLLGHSSCCVHCPKPCLCRVQSKVLAAITPPPPPVA